MCVGEKLSTIYCTGCGACAQICPSASITMNANKEGFIYPEIDTARCTGCRQCIVTCPLQQGKIVNITTRPPLKVLGAKNKDITTRMKSSSGGIFSALAHTIISQNGVVFGAAFNESMKLVHIPIFDTDNLSKLYGSKYVQSDTESSFRQAQYFLKQNRKVLFSGTSCQIAGLHFFLGKSYSNLFTCDFICKGVNSPLVFRKYIEYLERKNNSKVTSYSFRNKKNGWGINRPTIKIVFQDNTIYSELSCKDLFGRGFDNNLFLRPSCHNCRFKNFNTQSDITLGDMYGIEKINSSFDDGMGVSTVLVNSDKGIDLFNNCNTKISFITVSIDEIIAYSARIYSSSIPSLLRPNFFKDFQKYPFRVIVNRYLVPSFSRKVINKVLKLRNKRNLTINKVLTKK